MRCECDKYVNGVADNPPFSIRQFVVATRRKDIFQCWPFPQKYLQICLKYGITNVLPPFETYKAANKTTTETGCLVCAQQDKEHVFFESRVRDIVVQKKLIKDDYNSYQDKVLLEAPSHDSLKFHWVDSYKQTDESNLTSDYTSNAIVPAYAESSSMQGSVDLNSCQRINSLSCKRLRHKQRKHKRGLKKRSMLDILARAKSCTLEDIYKSICHATQ